MTDCKIILDMIEAVDPADTAKLDEIDSHVHVLVNDLAGDAVYVEFKRYTRSRDALKQIRPSKNEWGMIVAVHFDEYNCHFWTHSRIAPEFHTPIKEIEAKQMPTEELAELHAIIQAIAYERGNK